MSLNQKINVKLVRGEEIRLMHVVPKTWSEFQEALKTMYGSSDFQVTYVDEESDRITIGNDLDLSEAYSFASSKPSLKLYLKPISLIDDFEELKLEDPPKDSNPPQSAFRPEHEGFGRHCRGRGRWRWFGMMRNPGMAHSIKKKMKCFMRMHKNRSLKMKVISKNFPRHWVVASGSNIVVSWTVINKGKVPWPENTSLVDLDGELKISEPVSLGAVKPGDVVNICVNVSVPEQQGKYAGKWALMAGDEGIGCLKAKVFVNAENLDTKVLTIVSMGFSKEIATAALEESKGDLNLAVSNIVKNFSG